MISHRNYRSYYLTRPYSQSLFFGEKRPQTWSENTRKYDCRLVCTSKYSRIFIETGSEGYLKVYWNGPKDSINVKECRWNWNIRCKTKTILQLSKLKTPTHYIIRGSKEWYLVCCLFSKIFHICGQRLVLQMYLNDQNGKIFRHLYFPRSVFLLRPLA